MSNQDAARGDQGRPVKVIYETQSGVVFHITPVNLPTLRAINLKSQLVLPYPDPAPFQHILENAFVEGTPSPPEDNPDYIKAVQAVDHERAQWVDRAIFDYAVRCPAYPNKAALVEAHAAQLDSLRPIAVLPDDDYEAVLLHIVLSGNDIVRGADKKLRVTGSEYQRIIDIAIQTVALTPDEVTAGVRFFRPVV